jgi:hypothetical protein
MNHTKITTPSLDPQLKMQFARAALRFSVFFCILIGMSLWLASL